eukprot:TRINITY_DN13218_c0_g1_i1.p1 TRINITY_DN13218_c0_g1~~TRINITY_DN13218_c0_g1_i1.p1  ORF type:complete len:266 (+),score=94.16 TRINITY_DN13218_c0_g1_i1:77-799(+)
MAAVAVLAAAVLAALPAPPWREDGDLTVVVLEVPLAAAQGAVPKGFTVVESHKGSGVTKGSLYFARYATGAVGAYHELGFGVATVSAAGAQGAYQGQMFVDSEEALAGGVQLWGINKTMANFTVGTGADGWRSLSVSDAASGAPVLSADFGAPLPALPATTANVSTLSVAKDSARLGHVLHTVTQQHYAVQLLLSKKVSVPAGSPLRGLMDQGVKVKEAVHMKKASSVMFAAADLGPVPG